MILTAGIDVGSGAVKAVIMAIDGGGEPSAGGDGRMSGEHDASEKIIAHTSSRIRRRDIGAVVEEVFGAAVAAAGIDEIHYIATTGEGEDIPFATGHFYGMTTHARGALYLEPRTRSILDVGALHARAVSIDGRGKVLGYKMTSQCASGSGQFLENIARYLGVSQSEIGPLSLQATEPEKVSSICAVLAETDVINMVSRGISTPNILRGIHESMAARYARLLRSLDIEGVVFVSGGLAGDVGLIAALVDALEQAPPASGAAAKRAPAHLEPVVHPMSIFAGAIGAAIWGGFRYHKLEMAGVSWKARALI